MSQVSASSIKELIYNGGMVGIKNDTNTPIIRPLIHPVKDEDGQFIEGSAFDIRAHKIYRGIEGTIPCIDDDLREFVEVQSVEPEIDNGKMTWFLLPNTRYLVESLEEVAVPWYLRCFIWKKSSVFRMFNDLSYSTAHPGYCGPLVGLLSVGPFGLKIRVDHKIAYVTFSNFEGGTMIGDVDLYDKKANWGSAEGKSRVVPESGVIESK
jgi:deoxycytidine triphosphate deaminase